MAHSTYKKNLLHMTQTVAGPFPPHPIVWQGFCHCWCEERPKTANNNHDCIHHNYT